MYHLKTSTTGILMKNTAADSTECICLDANVLLEILDNRPQKDAAVRRLRKRGHYAISVLTVHLVMYFGLKAYTMHELKRFIDDFEILPVTTEDVAWAYAHVRGNDFEDALQLAAAVRRSCHTFYTFDKHLSTTYASLSQTKVKLLQ